MNPDRTSMWSALDPAPERPLTPDEEIRREQLLHRVLADRPSASAHRLSRLRSRTVLLAAGCLAVVLTVTAVGARPLLRTLIGTRSGGPALAAVDVASWTGIAMVIRPGTDAGSAAEDWCLEQLTGDPEDTTRKTIVSAESRGQVRSLIVEGGGRYFLCMVGQDDAGFTEMLDPPSPVAVGQVKAMTAGGHGNGDAGFDYVVGRVGDSVTRIVLTVDGVTGEARIEDGWWTIWWPDPHAAPPTMPDATVTVTVDDGTASSRPLRQLFG